MRKVLEEQLKLGEVDISRIEFDPKSRDGIPQLLKGLQYIYINLPLRDQVFDILKKGIKMPSKGRRGMDLWRILVFGVLRLNCNWDYDTLKEMADNHGKLREMLGHVPFFDKTQYPIQTLKDNVHLLTPALLDDINAVVVGAGHNLVKKKEKDLSARADSFVTDFFPDRAREVAGISLLESSAEGVFGFRQDRRHDREAFSRSEDLRETVLPRKQTVHLSVLVFRTRYFSQRKINRQRSSLVFY